MALAKKTGAEPVWFAWIPILNLILMAKIAGVELWTVILALLPIVNIFTIVWWWMKIAEGRGKPSWWGILMIVPIVNFVIMGMLAWGS